MSGRRRLALCSFILGGGFWSSTAGAFELEPPSVWYRSADGCPDGAAFVARLHGAAEGAKLASVADRIDFVVTLGMKDGRAFGRLERQTAEGRAAVRELAASTCEEVADAIALTLTLALEPQTSAAPAPDAPSAVLPTPASSVVSAPSPSPSTAVATPMSPSVPPPPPAPPATARPTPERPRRWLLGVELTGDKGSLPDILLGDRLFLELRTDVPWPGASVRVAGFFVRRSSSKLPEVDVTRFGARIEACPLALASGPFQLSPCVGFDAGEELARGTGSTALSDSALWLAASVFARGTWSVSRLVALEVAVGPTLPLTRNELLQAGAAQPLNRTEIIGGFVALGVGFRPR